MPSAARQRFVSLHQKSDLLRTHAGKLKKQTDAQAKLVFLHAALAAQVAAWDSYVKAVAKEYFTATADPMNPRYSGMHLLLQQRMAEAEKKLNTPNSENTRNFLLQYLGFDPWPCWNNIKFGSVLLSNALLIRDRLDEIFKLRHSFAHGFSMPTFNWNQNSAGQSHLDCKTILSTGNFLSSLCRLTDDGLSNHIASQHSIQKPW